MQILTYADNVNLIGDYIRTIERSMLPNVCNCIGLAVNRVLVKFLILDYSKSGFPDMEFPVD